MRLCVPVAPARRSGGTVDAVRSRAIRTALHAAGSRRGLARLALAELALLGHVGPRGYAVRYREGQLSDGEPAARRRIYAELWQEAAAELGARTRLVGDDVQLVELDGRSCVVRQNSVPLDHPVVLDIARDKAFMRRVLSHGGLRTPEQVRCRPDQLDDALQFLDRVESVVVKPSHASGGSGVTCGIDDPADLVGAFAFALRWSDSVVVESFTAGSEYRVLVLDGEVLSAVRRRPPVVVGDGRSSVLELVARTNARRSAAPREAGLYPLTADLDMVLTLRRTGMSLSAVPAAGLGVQVKTAVNESGPAENVLVAADELTADVAVRAAAALGGRLASVEMVRAGAGPDDVTVIEVNASPGLHYHYLVRNAGVERPVAVVILERLLETGEWPATPAQREAGRGPSPWVVAAGGRA